MTVVTHQARFVYQEGVFGEWTGLVTGQSLYPNPGYTVACVEYRAIGPDGQQVSTGRQPRSGKGTNRARRVPNGAGS
jgi:hypothetical protein